MDPASAFELALTGLATKDLDEPLPEFEPEHELAEDNVIKKEIKKESDDVGDILLQALIGAGVSEETKPQQYVKPEPRFISVINNSVKISAVSDTKPLRIVVPSKFNQKHTLIQKKEEPESWRKRNPSTISNGPPVKIIKTLQSNGFSSVSNLNSLDSTSKFPQSGLTRVHSYSTFNSPIARPFQLQKRDDDLEEEDDLAQADTYANYVPQKLKFGQPHPDPVVESSTLSSVSPPEVRYRLCLPDEVINSGVVSALQLEAVVYASQRHQCMLPNGQRAGFLVGDGAGVGKGRTIAAIIYENYVQKRRKAIWISVSNDLRVDAQRDLHDVGLSKMKIHSLNKFKYARISSKVNGKVKKGVIFSTYSSLIGESQGKTKAKYKSRLKQLVQWCGKDFDGVIVFDECHKAKNLTPSGSQKPTKTGLTVLELQNRLPKARIVYASATGATEPRNMAYMTRLGLWGEGTPFKTFNSFIQTLERRGVGAMELVAMDMKLRGMYLARQLSFEGVDFNIEEINIEDVCIDSEPFVNVYNQSADLWVYFYKRFADASQLMIMSEKFRKTMWGQFWSAHQRFFKYLCISAKIDKCVEITKTAIKEGKCVVIGLQTTGEAKTLEYLEEYGTTDMNEFVSTAKGVLQSLVDKYFPTQSNLDNFHQRGQLNSDDRASSSTLSRAGRAVSAGIAGSGLGLKDILGEKMFAKLVSGGSLSGSQFDNHEDHFGMSAAKRVRNSSSSDDSDLDSEDSGDDDSSDLDMDPSDLQTDSDDPSGFSSRKSKKKAKNKRSNPKTQQQQKSKKRPGCFDEIADMDDEGDDLDPDSMFDQFLARKAAWDRETTSVRHSLWCEDSTSKFLNMRTATRKTVSEDEARRQTDEMQAELLHYIDNLSRKLPPSSLDELIDRLGGPTYVAEMTGRKGRMVMDDSGRVLYESRRENDVTLEILNLTEKQRFMDGDKLVAIISEAASSGISLQADRRALNQRRRVHITLELPWSADRAIQQFGRTHRSNQVSSPQYVFLISDLAGEQRFASTVAKRLESLGALTHGDRRATDTRDLSKFNFDTKFGKDALDIVVKSCISGEVGIVNPPVDYVSEADNAKIAGAYDPRVKHTQFFADVRASLQGVGLMNNKGRDRESSQMTKFLNRMLGMRVNIQNGLFRYFSDTLDELLKRAKREKKLDLGIMDLGTTGQNIDIDKVWSFDTHFLSDLTQIHVHKVLAQRGMNWSTAMEIYTEHEGEADGFYLPRVPNPIQKINVPLLAIFVRSGKEKKSGSCLKYYRIIRPNTGIQSRNIELDKLLEKYKRVSNPSDCRIDWSKVFNESSSKCIHAIMNGSCSRASLGRKGCEIGLRTRTYYVLSGSVLNVWGYIEPLIQSKNYSVGGQCMQVVRLKPHDSKRIVGSLIPSECLEDVLRLLQDLQDNPVQTNPSDMNEVFPPSPYAYIHGKSSTVSSPGMSALPKLPLTYRQHGIPIHHSASLPSFLTRGLIVNGDGEKKNTESVTMRPPLSGGLSRRPPLPVRNSQFSFVKQQTRTTPGFTSNLGQTSYQFSSSNKTRPSSNTYYSDGASLASSIATASANSHVQSKFPPAPTPATSSSGKFANIKIRWKDD
ncbi:Protein strawberry notch 1 [Cichlidogyrus casuarinus]|uniref:Protein strawberry notch 1 n=1 Tax=Cichlidogyrus casuarinus TaxID=1844966 RepID=A0ABD2QMC6_9PLAT